MLSELKRIGFFESSTLYPSKTLHLHSMLINCGYQRVTHEQYNYDGMKRGSREFAIWQYTIEGSGRLMVKDREYHIDPGHAMMVHIPQEHRYYLPSGGYWEFVYLSFNGRELLRLWDEAEKRIGPVAGFGEDSKSLSAFFEIFKARKEGRLINPFQASAMAYNFVMSLFEDYQVEEAGNPVPSFIKTVVDFCFEHIAEPIGVDEMAEAAGYSRYHFTRLFTKSQGMSPALFLKQLRLKQAERLLQTELLTVNEIAYRCGFDDPSYFCKIFRKEYGISPGDYRYVGGS